jgi:ribosomal protein L11 methyltransferase
MNYLQFDFIVPQGEKTEALIAVLGSYNFEGFEETEQCLKAFIAEDKLDGECVTTISQLFPDVSYKKSIIENINWNQQWEENFHPVIVSDFVAIRAHFHPAIAEVKHEIIITPKMSFGTGHHATTHMMIELMQAVNFAGKKVLDLGTGTGVLAILAEKMGATEVLAIDNDEWSIENSKENIIQNNCTAINIILEDSIKTPEKFEVILANINLNIILTNLPSIAAAAGDDADILLSGFLKQDEITVKNALITNSLLFISTLQIGEWIAVTAKNKIITSQ